MTFTDVLETAEIPCRWIPVFPVHGEEIEIDGKVVRSGLIRNAKGPSVMYDYWMTAATEEVTLRPKTPYIGAEGQFEGMSVMAARERADLRVSRIQAEDYRRKSRSSAAAANGRRPCRRAAMAMHAADEIKATTGIFDSSLGAREQPRAAFRSASKAPGKRCQFPFQRQLDARACARGGALWT